MVVCRAREGALEEGIHSNHSYPVIYVMDTSLNQSDFIAIFSIIFKKVGVVIGIA